ncbi:MAG: glycosyltransferase family 39 protein [Bacteroidota bacterium]
MASFLVILSISLMKDAVELEDAEQAYYSQWWRWGYDDQPPLYTWLQKGINGILGVSKVSFSILRGLIFASFLVVLYRFAKQFLEYSAKATLVILMLICIPVFIDFTFRRLSHTALLCLVIVANYWVILRLILKKSLLNYLFLGLLLGMGLLTKYNFVLFLGALGLGVCIDGTLRSVFFHPYMLLSTVLCGLLIFPHFNWLLENQEYFIELQRSIRFKTGSSLQDGITLLAPFGTFLLTLVKYTIYLLALAGLMIFLKKWKLKKVPWEWFAKLLVCQLAVLLLFFMGLNVQKVEARWLLPLLLPFLALLVKMLDIPNTGKWIKIGFYGFLAILALQLIRTPAERLLGIPSDVHFGFSPISEKLRKDYPDQNWLLPDVTYGGNIRLLNPEREVFSEDDFSLPSKKKHPNNGVWIRTHMLDKNKETKYRLADSIMGFGRSRETLYFYQY